MGTIQVVLGSTLVQAADRAARRTGQNRSGLIRDALREHLRRMEIRELEARDRRGYETIEEATLKAKDLLEKEQDLGLAVIYKESPDGTRDGVKFIYKDEDGAFEDFQLYWGSCDSCFEG